MFVTKSSGSRGQVPETQFFNKYVQFYLIHLSPLWFVQHPTMGTIHEP